VDTVQKLLYYGADKTALNEDGKTAEQVAFKMARGQICSTIASWHQFTGPEEAVRKKKKAELMATKSLAAQAAEGEPPSIFLQLQSLAMKEHKVGRDHLDLCRTLDKLVEAYLDEGRPADAIAAMDRILQITTKAYGVVHMETAKVTNNLAQVMDASGSPEGALPLFAVRAGAGHGRGVQRGVQCGCRGVHAQSGPIITQQWQIRRGRAGAAALAEGARAAAGR
jgi:hypothetical protein